MLYEVTSGYRTATPIARGCLENNLSCAYASFAMSEVLSGTSCTTMIRWAAQYLAHMSSV
jgi:hypothetical protein